MRLLLGSIVIMHVGVVTQSMSAQCRPFALSRTGFTLLVIEDRVYCFGGQDPESGLCYNDVHKLDLARKRWEKVEASSGRPAPRHAYCAGLVGSHSFAIFGGANQSNECVCASTHLSHMLVPPTELWLS